MRTTLDIDDDILHAVKERACRERKTAGQLMSEPVTNEPIDELRNDDAYQGRGGAKRRRSGA
jgi:hypothetical protein